MTLGNVKMLTIVVVLLTGLLSAHAQMREVVIENTGLLECIQDAIMADLAANGEEVVNNTKYILKRGETYVHSTQYQPSHKVWLEAEPGDGPLPRILGVNTGGEAPRMVRSTNDMTFIGLRYEGLDSDGNHTDNAPCRQRGDGTKMTAKNNIFPNHRLEIFRVDGGNQTWIVENNLVVQNYQKDLWDKGYTFSFHDDKVDSFIIKNNTFYNSTCGLMHSDLTAGATYVEFSQNTLHNLGGLYQGYVYQGSYEAAMINFGVAQNVVCKDNLIIDCMTFGYEPEWADSISIINVNLTDSTGTIDVSNNNIWRDPEFAELNPPEVEMIKWFDPELESLIGDGSGHGFISEPVAFNSVPGVDPMKEAVPTYFSAPDAMLDPDAIMLDETPDPEAVDFGYTSKLSPTAGSTGGPLGAERWHSGVKVGVESQTPAHTAGAFKLHGNYPNPFNPSTTIRFDLPNQAKVRVKVMNLRGQVVYESPEKMMARGNNKEISLDASGWASGLYMYQVTAGESTTQRVVSGRMLLLK